MAENVTAATVKALAREMYGYQLSDEHAQRVAAITAVVVRNSRTLETLDLTAIEPPFGYANLQAEAKRLRRSHG
jgi:hypothetical protein